MSGNGGELLLLDSNTSNPSCSTAPSQAPQSSGSARPRHSKHSSNGGTPRQTQTFQQLVGMLEALISQKEEAMGGGGKRFEQIQAIFKQLKQIFLAEESQSKRQAGIQILHNAYEILAHLIFLKSGCLLREGLNSYVDRTLKALKQTTSLSHDQYVGPVRALENRKLQLSLCLVESLTELLVQDVDTFGLPVDCYEKCGKMRREIANALMNLVYQQRDAKLRLCSDLAFLRRVSDIIGQVPSLDQYYAGLIQNVSYNSDKKAILPFAHHLAITVPPLVHVAIIIMRKSCHNQQQSMANTNGLSRPWDQQQKQRLYKILSALWNLAEDPIENKRVMCHDFPDFVPLLLCIMMGDPREVPLIQAATGILKHLCGFILQYPELFSKILNGGAVRALLHQLYSSSSDLIIDALFALSVLCKHPYAAQELLRQQRSLQDIQYLTKNTNEGIVRAARALMDAVNSVYYQVLALQNGMCNSSVIGWSNESQPNQILYNVGSSQFVGQFHYNTLPKATQSQQLNVANQQKNVIFGPTVKEGKITKDNQQPQETPKGALKQPNPNTFSVNNSQQQNSENNAIDNRHRENLVNANNVTNPEEEGEEEEQFDGFITEPCIEAGQDLSTSVQCTRAVSPESVHSGESVNDVKNGEEWPSARCTSTVNSRWTSGADSPASASDLPDSPSQCASHKPFQLEAMALVIKKALEEKEEENESSNSDLLGNEQQNDDRGPNVSGNSIESEGKWKGEEGRTSENCENTDSGGTLVEEDTGGNNSVNDHFLDEIIRNYMPKPQVAVLEHAVPSSDAYQFVGALNTTPILTPISTNSPCKSPVRRSVEGAKKHFKAKKNRDNQLLEESIASMMPNPIRNDFDQQQVVHVTADLPADVDAEFKAQWVVVECGGMTSPQKSNEEPSDRFMLKKTSSQSSIPRPLPTTTSSKRMMDNNATANSSSMLRQPIGINKVQSSSGQNSKSSSPQKRIHQISKKLPPPLAPKPSLANITKNNSHHQQTLPAKTTPAEKGGE